MLLTLARRMEPTLTLSSLASLVYFFTSPTTPCQMLPRRWQSALRNDGKTVISLSFFSLTHSNNCHGLARKQGLVDSNGRICYYRCIMHLAPQKICDAESIKCSCIDACSHVPQIQIPSKNIKKNCSQLHSCNISQEVALLQTGRRTERPGMEVIHFWYGMLSKQQRYLNSVSLQNWSFQLLSTKWGVNGSFLILKILKGPNTLIWASQSLRNWLRYCKVVCYHY